MDANRVERGRHRGRVVQLPQNINSNIIPKLRPFPTNSSIYTQRNCIIRMNITTSRIAKNGPTNDFNMNRSSLFTGN
jgi:hypothetical protein